MTLTLIVLFSVLFVVTHLGLSHDPLRRLLQAGLSGQVARQLLGVGADAVEEARLATQG